MVDVNKYTDVKANPCNSCSHRDCCKYTETLQEAVTQMTEIRQIQSDNKVFELQSKVFFSCPMYKETTPSCGINTQRLNIWNHGVDVQCCKENIGGEE